MSQVKISQLSEQTAFSANTGNSYFLIYDKLTGTTEILSGQVAANGLFANSSTITFADGTKQNTAASPVAYSISGYTQANSANILAQSVFNEANTANLIANTAQANITFLYANVANAWAQANAAIILAQSGFNKANAANILAQAAAYIPNPITSNGIVYATSANTIQSSNTISINDANGTVYLGNGIVRGTTGFPLAQTSITLNFANDYVVWANVNSSATISLSNLRAGREILLYLSSNTGGNKDITFGLQPWQSTHGGTSFTMVGVVAARLDYFCMDGTLANTFVSIHYQ